VSDDPSSQPAVTEPMLECGARSTDDETKRGAEHMARLLAGVGGYVDAVGFVALFQLFIAHQSGNSAGLGVALGNGSWTDAWPRGVAIGAYVVGIALGTLLVELARWRGARSTGVVVAAAELVALGAALGIGAATSHAGHIPRAMTVPYATAASCLAGAMGLQTVMLRRVGQRTVRTTFVTGVLSDFAETFVVSWFRPDRLERWRLVRLSGLLGSVWVLYLAGAVAGGVAQRNWSFGSLAVPIALVAGVSIWEFHAGYGPSLPEEPLGD